MLILEYNITTYDDSFHNPFWNSSGCNTIKKLKLCGESENFNSNLTVWLLFLTTDGYILARNGRKTSYWITAKIVWQTRELPKYDMKSSTQTFSSIHPFKTVGFSFPWIIPCTFVANPTPVKPRKYFWFKSRWIRVKFSCKNIAQQCLLLH